jgi:hypothetical protein
MKEKSIDKRERNRVMENLKERVDGGRWAVSSVPTPNLSASLLLVSDSEAKSFLTAINLPKT